MAFVVGDPFTVDTKYSKSSIWTVNTANGISRQFTFGPRSDTAPRWSPDGKNLAFLSDRDTDGQRQIYILSTAGGEAQQITYILGKVPSPRSLSPMAWAPDGSQIAFLMTDTDTEEEKFLKKEKKDAIEFEKHNKFTRINVVDVKTKKIVYTSPPTLQIWEFCWSPSNNEFAAVVSDQPIEQAWYTCRLSVIDMDSQVVETVHASKRQVANPTWSPNGKSIAFLSSNWSDRGLTAGSVFIATLDGTLRHLSKGHKTSAFALDWSADSNKIITFDHEQGGMGVGEIQVSTGKRISLHHGNVAFSATGTTFSQDTAGTIAAISEGDGSPPDVGIAKRTGTTIRWTHLSHMHPNRSDFNVGEVKTLYWKSKDNLEIQGLFILPKTRTYKDNPMVTIVHGGPTGMTAYRYMPAFQYYGLLAAAGIAVFLPNPRGSTGWGLDFAESNIGDMGGMDWQDIHTGIEYCVSNGLANPKRLGLCGGSYGGFMTAWGITQEPEKFKAAVMISGISDWRSFHGRSHLSTWDSIHYGDANPWDPMGIHLKYSPITYVRNVRTPTLILHGENDWDVPVEQSYIFYRALKDLGIDTELVVYPREAHGFREKNHILDQYQRTVNWFTEYLS